jgi:hypothetical protein
MPILMPTGKQQYFYMGTSKPLAGGKIYTYAAGSSTPKVTYQDAAGSVPNTNPIVLDSTGSALIFWSGSYKVVVLDAMGNTVSTVDDYNTDPYGLLNIQPQLAAPAGADMVGYLAAGSGAQKRSLLDRGRDTVSAFDYMTPTQVSNVRAGIPTDITAAAQAAINSLPTFAGTVLLPPGNFRLSAPLVTGGKGLILKGASKYGTYLTAADGATFDMIRIAHQQCEVCGIIFRPGSATQVPIRAYAGRAYIHDNYLLAGVNNAGIGILLTDTSPVDGSFIAGAYNHTVENNIIGDSGFAFANGIYESSQFGITATRFVKNTILSDRPIQINKGGGNTYRDNLLQSSTGTASTKTGVGITLGAGVVGEKIQGNYVELFLAMIETRSTDNTYQLFHAIGNHNDNCAAPVADAGAKNYILEDAVGKVVNNFGWSIRSTATQWGVNTPGAVNAFGADTTGNCFMGANSGASHIINKPGSTEGAVILNLQGAGSSVGYVQDARGAGPNGGATCLALNKNSGTGRSLNSAGSNNAQGNDYAEYMTKAPGVGIVAKGQIVGITANDEITDRWPDAVAFAVKSTDPSYVGGDTWAVHLGARPTEPIYVDLEYVGVTAGRPPVKPESIGDEERDEAAAEIYNKALADWAATRAQEQADRAAFAAQVDQARADHKAAMDAWEAADEQYDVDYEAARVTVDRVAFAGRVPVNVLGATPGQYIVPVQDGGGIKGIAMNEADMTLSQYMRAVGLVTTIEPDGRARIIVKLA